METNSKIDDLIRQAWQIYKQFEGQDFLVMPSIPILFFGDSNQYLSSKLKVITLGLNPSKVEFPKEDRFLRFSDAREVYPRILEGAFYDEYLQALNDYFHSPPNHPYEAWFNAFEPLLNGLDCSYYGKAPNTALHTDLCSPLATNPTWGKLPRETQGRLIQHGNPLWCALVEWLSPDLIIASVAKQYLDRISSSPVDDWGVACAVERRKPYEIKATKLRIRDRKDAWLVYGRAAQTPFGPLSNVDKRKIGHALKEYAYA